MSQAGKKTEDEIEAQLAPYLSAPYIHMIIPTADGRYLAEVLELPGCITDGRTPEEAYNNLKEAMSGYLSAHIERDTPIPEAVGLKELSGNIPLRISSELHRMAALRARQEGISLNQWIGKAIAMQATGEELGEKIAEAVASKMANRVQLSATLDATLSVRMDPQQAWEMPTEFIGPYSVPSEMTGRQAFIYAKTLEREGVPLKIMTIGGVAPRAEKPRAKRLVGPKKEVI